MGAGGKESATSLAAAAGGGRQRLLSRSRGAVGGSESFQQETEASEKGAMVEYEAGENLKSVVMCVKVEKPG